MVSSLFCRTMILMLQQQQMNQQMQHQQNISQYLQGSQYPNAPWWTDGAMEYWPPCPKPEVRHLLSLFLLWSQNLLHAAPAAEPETTAAAPETTPAAPAAEPAAPTVEGAGAALEDDSWLRWCNLCGERSYWRENACLNPHCTVTRQIFVKYVIIIRRCKISCNPSFLMVSL